MLFFIQVTLCLPRSSIRFNFAFANFWIDLALITCLKYWHFLFFIVGNSELVVFAMFNASSLVLCSVNDYILLTFFYTPSSQKPLIYTLNASLVRVHVSQPCNNVDHIREHCNILFLVCILIFLDLSTLDISWNAALFANAILRFTSF